MTWVILILFVIAVGYLLDREIYFYEGVHLGPRMQAWLYDHWSKKYDAGKRESQLRDEEMLARPLLDLLQDVREPFILDFATGTGRLSFALLSQAGFKGRIVALDLSQGMLEQAAAKLSALEKRSSVELLRHFSLPLPFPNATFDAVCALEVLELFPSMDEPLAELTRVLRPGGILLTSRGTEESGRKAKVKSRSAFTSLLEKYNLHYIEITKWWKFFDRVIARKNGEAQSAEARDLSRVLRCTKCGKIEWQINANAWLCKNCDAELVVTNDGILVGK